MKLKQLIIVGIRPKTLVAALIPPLVAQALIYKEAKDQDWYIILHCLGLGLFIQIATNFYNDAIDFKKGADEKRVGPKRITDTKTISIVYKLAHASLFIAFMFGIPLVIKGGAPFLLLGVISLYFAYGYTGGPFPLAYLGLGELFVFLFFGLLATCGSYYLVTQSISLNSLILASQIGLLSCALIAINNFRDRKTDHLVFKKTLATKLSELQFFKLIDLFLFGPYILLLYFILFVDLRFFAVLFAIRFAHIARKIVRDYSHESELNVALENAGKHLLVFGLLFCLCCL